MKIAIWIWVGPNNHSFIRNSIQLLFTNLGNDFNHRFSFIPE